MKKLFPMLLASLTLLSLSACGQTSLPDATAIPAVAEVTEEPIPEVTVTEPPAPDFDAAYAKYAPDTPVLSVDGYGIDWEIYFGALSQRVNFFWLYYGMRDYGLEMEEDGETVGDWIREQAEIDLRSMAMFRPWAEELGITLTEEDYAAIDAEIGEYADAWYGGDLEAMFADLGASEAFTRFQGEYARLNDAVFAHYFGKDGASLPDADVLAYAQEKGYVYGKRILFRTTDDTGYQLSDEEKAEKRAEAEAALAELQAYPPEELPERFDAMMRARSEDAGLEVYPDGYYFTEGEFDAMYKPLLALAEGEMSGIVECDYGYQIIFRPPMDPEHVFETDADTGYVYTLRRWAAGMLFNNIAEERYEAAAVEYAPEFAQLDIAALFGA